ncbi:MAG: helix-turn-helix transcriptional regulator [Phycisphaerales bacterium]|nr:helix-turn-helix transcriptional regulator [Phycisphaerales bacterium]
MSRIYDALREAIEASEHSRYRLSLETGISQATLCEFVHGRRGMSVENIEILLDALQLDIVVQPAKQKRKRR